ncbi:MAG: DNA-3-methyladenine glycosylase I [Bacteroidales bacterium]|nr:DNA-3-methyladenine glycosylase I [Lentimicrobiaceae bacterium]MDD5693853.1 DNA-3-methyladenine glycosylase I [Bacteroidales bacterium]
MEIKRCQWPDNDLLMIRYHDQEWGTPIFEDQKLFEYIVLGTFQAGLNWRMILHKRDNFRKAFLEFNPQVIALFKQNEINSLLENKGIIRNKAKIVATVNNATRFLEIQKNYGTFSGFIWSYTKNKPIHNSWTNISQIPSRSELSDRISRDLIKAGFKFAGTKIVYAFLQAIGMVNDHTKDCFRYREIQAMVL